jgi:YaiO family outer membrane protein
MRQVMLFLSLLLAVSAGGAFAQPSPTPEAAPTAAGAKSDEPPKYEVQLQASQESLSGGRGTWQTAAVYFERRFAGRRLAWASYRASRRNRTRDQEFIGGAYQPFAGKWALTAEAMFSNTHQYVGKFSVMAEGEKTLGRGWVAHAGARYTAYNRVKATSVYGLAEKYWGNHRAAYTLYVTRLTGAGTAPTQRLQYNRYFGEKPNTLGASFSYGREHENLGPQIGILRNKTWSASVAGRFWLTEKIGFSLDASVHRQGNLYYRRGLNVGIRYRF